MEQMTKPWLWKPGQSGNPNGRPPGARTHFSEAFLNDLRDTWLDHGKEIMIKTAKAEPTAFFATCARLIPKDVAITVAQQYPSGLEPADFALLRACREAIPGANERTPEQVFSYALAALRAHSAKLVCDLQTRKEDDKSQ
jgi:hypothetical protein